VNRSAKFSNLLSAIDSLDPAVFDYYGKVGAVEFQTQDTNHKMHVSTRTLNGDYSKTFPGLNDVDAFSADTSREMIIQNLVNNASYRAAVGCFNPSDSSVTVEFRLIAGAGSLIGSVITRTLAGHGYLSFFPFEEAGRPYPSYSYDNAFLRISPTSGSGKVLCFGATANNITNDPAAHFAAQAQSGFDNSPTNHQILPEVIWSAASGGGTWVTECQITDFTGGSQVSAYFCYEGGIRRGPFPIWASTGQYHSMKFNNLLSVIDGLDPGAFAYYGQVGAVEFLTQDTGHTIQVSARTLNGNYSKTYPGLNNVEAYTCDTSRDMMIQNLVNNGTYRSAIGCFNLSGDSVTVEFQVMDANGITIGGIFTRTIAGYGFTSFFPFNEAGRPYPAYSHDNTQIQIRAISGTGKIMCFGATANNNTNDPAAHLSVIRGYLSGPGLK
jgi:hypothetical protein